MKNEIESPILSKAIVRGGTHLYRFTEALELVNLCQKSALPVLGIDSFLVTSSKTQPFMEHSVDLSDSQNSYEEAKVFLNIKKDLGFVFEVVY